MAEPTPGAPGGGSSGPRSATAATFQVNDGSLKTLHTTFRTLIKDVNEFNAALQGLSKGTKTVDALHAKLSGLGVGGGGSSSGGSGGSAATGGTGGLGGNHTFSNASTGTQQNVVVGGDAHFTNTGSSASEAGEQQRQSTGMLWTKRGIAGGVGLAAAVGGYFNRSMGDISDLNLAYTQAAQGRGFSRGAVGDARTQLMRNVGGYQSAQDLLGGVQTITSAIGSTVGSTRSNAVTSAVGGMAAAMPGMGYAGAAAGVSQLYNPVVANRLRGIGAAPRGQHGALSSPGAVYQQVQRLVFRGQRVTPSMIAEGMQPGAPLFITLQALGLDDAGMEAFRQYALAQANLGGNVARTNQALHDASLGKQTADTKAAGLTTSIRSGQNRLGMAETRRAGEAERESGDALRDSFNGLAHTVDLVTRAFRDLNGATGGGSGAALGAAGVFGGPLAGAVSAAGGIGGIGFTVSTIKGALGGLRRGGTRGGRAGGALGGAASAALGMSGIEGTPVFVTNMPAGGFGGGGGGLPGLKTAEKDAEKAAEKGIFKRLAARFGLGGAAAGAEGAEAAAGGGALAGLGGAAGAAALPAAAVAAGVAASFGAHRLYNFMQSDGAHRGGALGWVESHAAGTAKMFNAWDIGRRALGFDQGPSKDDQKAAQKLQDAEHKFARGGYMSVPACAAEYHGRVEPMVKKGANNRKKHDCDQARAALNQLMSKYQSEVSARNIASGKTAAGQVFHSMFDASGTGNPAYARGSNAGQDPTSYGIGQQGGAAVGVGGGAQTSGRATTPQQPGNGAAAIIGTAESFLGRPYQWGGASPKTSFDCSGLMQWSFGQHGIKLPRTAAQQQRIGGQVDPSKMQPGDLVFYGTPAHHVAMYVGGGQMVEAPHTGASIRLTKLRSPDGGVRRVLGGRNDYSGPSSTTSGTSGPVGDSGDGPPQAPPRNLANAPGVLADEASAFANILNQQFGSTGPALPSAVRKSSPAGSASGNAGQNVGSSPSAPVTGTLGTWIKTALGILHLNVDKYSSGIATIIQHESGGNPRAQNNWDSNAKAGHPSKGLMQTIDETFNRWALPGHHNIWNPVDNIIAGTRYSIGRYGSLDNVPGIKSLRAGGPYKGYLQGAWNTPEGPALLHADEMVLPARTARKVRGMIARQTGPGAGTTLSIPAQASGGATKVTIHAPITVVGKATQQDAIDFLHMVKEQAETNHTLDSIGAG